METNINKLISVWRGDNTPPTDYHLWEKSDGSIFTKVENQWKLLTSPIDKETLDDLSKDVSKLKKLLIVEITPTSSSILNSYLLKADDSIYGTIINIPKDKSLKDAKLGYADATVNTITGEINIGTAVSEGPLYLIYSMAINDGTYTMIKINLSLFLTDKEYADGLELTNNKLKVKVDSSSEEYLFVSANGVKILGVDAKFSDLYDRIALLDQATFSVELLQIDNTWKREAIENLLRLNDGIRYPKVGDLISEGTNFWCITQATCFEQQYSDSNYLCIFIRYELAFAGSLGEIKLKYITNIVLNDGSEITNVLDLYVSTYKHTPHIFRITNGKITGKDLSTAFFLKNGDRKDQIGLCFARITYIIDDIAYTRLVQLSNCVTKLFDKSVSEDIGYIHLSGIANNIEGIEGLSLVELIFKVNFSTLTILDNGTYKVRSLQIKDYIGDGLKLDDSGKIVLDIPEGYELILSKKES